MYKNEFEQGSKAARIVFLVFAAFVVSATVITPLASVSAKDAIERDSISVSIGIDRFIGFSSIENVPGEEVEYSDGVYSKTMVGGEKKENFGTTTFNIICNFDINDDSGYNCRDNGWVLTAASAHTATEGGTTYASMISDSSSATILSKSNSFSSTESNWGIQVSPVSRTIEGSDVSPTITSGYTSPHTIPATTTAIASGKSWKTINKVDTYIDGFGVGVQYGINIDGSQAAGTYTGTVNYTVSLKASS